MFLDGIDLRKRIAAAPAAALVAAFALIAAMFLQGCSGGSDSASSGSASSAGSQQSASISLDKAVTQSSLSYKVSSGWTQSGNASSSSASAYTKLSFATGDAENTLSVVTDDVSFMASPEDEVEKLRNSWIDYQGGKDWSATKVQAGKIGACANTVYTCDWTMKTGTQAHVKVAFVQGDALNAQVSYFYTSGNADIFDQVLATLQVS